LLLLLVFFFLLFAVLPATNVVAYCNCFSGVGSIFEAFVPPEGDGVASLLSGKVTNTALACIK